MTTSLITFERDFRQRLLDVVYGQWHDLGAPFSNVSRARPAEVIDPEALLWCSFEFLPTEPRLNESLQAWLLANPNYIIRQRLNKVAGSGDPRTNIWCALDKASKSKSPVPSEPCHGLDSPAEVTEFCEGINRDLQRGKSSDTHLGRPIPDPSTVLLRARDLLGNDIRHFLLVYLLATPGGGKLRTVQKWSGYSYRSISETAGRWEAAGVVAIDHGYCRLSDSAPWHTLLRRHAENAILVNWFQLFGAGVCLLRALAKARSKDLSWDSAVVTAHRRDACTALISSLLNNDVPDASASVAWLRDLFPQDDQVGAASRRL